MHAEIARIGTGPSSKAGPPFSKRFVSWLPSLRKSSIDEFLDISDFMQQKIMSAKESIEEVAKKDRVVKSLETIASVFHVVIIVIKTKVGDLGQSGLSDGLASYAGLALIVGQVGEKRTNIGSISGKGP